MVQNALRVLGDGRRPHEHVVVLAQVLEALLQAPPEAHVHRDVPQLGALHQVARLFGDRHSELYLRVLERVEARVDERVVQVQDQLRLEGMRKRPLKQINRVLVRIRAHDLRLEVLSKLHNRIWVLVLNKLNYMIYTGHSLPSHTILHLRCGMCL